MGWGRTLDFCPRAGAFLGDSQQERAQLNAHARRIPSVNRERPAERPRLADSIQHFGAAARPKLVRWLT